MPVMLPDEVQRALGFIPPAPPAPAAPAPDAGPPQFLPSIAAIQATPYGQPAPPTPPPSVDNPPQFTALSAPPGAEQPAAPAPERDYRIPVEAIAPEPQRRPQPVQSQPAHAPGVDGQLAQSRQFQAGADQASLAAIDSQEAVDRSRAADELAAYGAHDQQAQAIEKQRKAVAEETAKTHAAKQLYAQGVMTQADNYKVDQDKYMKTMGGGDKLRWGIAMILSNVGEAMQGKSGPNPILQMLQEKMHQSVVQQVDERDRLRLTATHATHDLDKYDAYSKDRQAQISLLDAANERKLAKMLVESAAKYKDAQAQVNAQKGASELLQSSAKKLEESTQFAANFDMKKKDQEVARGQLGVSQFNAGESKRHNLVTEEMAQQGKDLEALKLERAGQADQAKLVRERSIGGEVHEVKDANGKVIGSELGAIRNKDGSVFIPKGGPTEYAKLVDAHNATLELDATLAEIQRLGPEWLSDASNSAKKQKLDQLGSTAKNQAIKALGLGVPTGRDVEMATGFIGTTDPTRFRDATAGIAQARKTLNTAHNVQLHTAGLDRDWESPNLATIPKAAPTAVEKLVTALKREPDENPERASTAAFAEEFKTQQAAGKDTRAAIAAANGAAADASRAASAGGVTPKRREGIETLKALAIGGGPEAGDAILGLEDLANSKRTDTTGPFGIPLPWEATSSKGTRKLAEEALSEIRASKEQGTITSAGPTHDPNAYDPQSLIDRFHRRPEPTFLPPSVSSK